MCIDIEPSQTTPIEGKGPGRARHLMNVLWDQTVLTYIKVSENHHQLEEHGKYSFAMCRAELTSDNLLLPVSVLAEVPFLEKIGASRMPSPHSRWTKQRGGEDRQSYSSWRYKGSWNWAMTVFLGRSTTQTVTDRDGDEGIRMQLARDRASVLPRNLAVRTVAANPITDAHPSGGKGSS
ncbi:hypothetical protein ARMGADRAFT_1034860 [Armillaria gallica]|uniref:Uncharacterized protein n=1 Tax=Armillaria gallica TaxID=47427 RepID=A0A2H3CZP6_ARMGA|nr:hypothetical protein ARMGADRAFT_1034860 [Armillaria gallica]